MILPDVNVLVYALRREMPEHERHRSWLEATVNGPAPFALSDEVLASVVRVVTHPRIFTRATAASTALSEVGRLRSRPNAVALVPGARHWGIFEDLLRSTKATGNLVPDAWLAALAIEHGCTLITADRGFARFPELQHRDAAGAAS